MGNSTVTIAELLVNITPGLADAADLNLENLPGSDKLYFDKLICKNVGPTPNSHHVRSGLQVHGRSACRHQSAARH